jgi:hypothetical protein
MKSWKAPHPVAGGLQHILLFTIFLMWVWCLNPAIVT